MKSNSFYKTIFLFIIFSASFFVLSTGCGSGDNTKPNCSDSTAHLTGKFFSLSDIHFDPYYDTTLLPQLVKTNVQGWEAIFQSSQLKTYSPYNVDANYLLMSSAFSSMSAL